MKRLLPSYPLFLKDPFFNVWIGSEDISATSPSYFNKRAIPMVGLIKTKDKLYRFLGDEFGEKMEVTDVSLSAMQTVFVLKNEEFKITLKFVSPLTLDDLDLLSMPTCMLDYEIETDVKDYQVIFSVSSKILSNSTENDYAVRGDEIADENYVSAYFGKYKQDVLSLAVDSYTCEHGYYYLTAKKAYCHKKEDYLKVLSGEDFINPVSCDERFITGINEESGNAKGKFILSFDDVASIYYYGEILRGYYFRNGKTITDAISYTYENYTSIMEKVNSFDKSFEKENALSPTFYEIAVASYRQAIAGHKLVRDGKGRTLFLSKEMSSGGCIATVDVTFPELPLFLLYNPSLVKGMLYPIFDFAKMKAWPYEFAPHDAGVYPYVIGQFYSVKHRDEDDKGRTLAYMEGAPLGTLPPYYLYKDGNAVYSIKRQMPYEECSNMIIATYLQAFYSKDKSLLKENYGLLKQWADYLVKNGTIPDNQLCTDDFAGHQEKNLNLSIKSVVALNDFAKITKLLRKREKTDYKKIAEERRDEIEKTYINTYLPLTFNNEENSFSIKYNLAVDLADGKPIFSQSTRDKEIKEYLNRINKYSIPLDTREKYTKSDWICWVASLTDDISVQDKFFEGIVKFLKESGERVPFSDWFNTTTAEIYMFKNRTVQAGVFMPVLIKKIKDGGKL